ncbi:serine/threonine/tyrosine-interacting-like protein 1 isoform X1 [Malaclemys terrapin pileata]|uniref:serine/threonine/tyrosine-interacting-like protein 1 isoform X1 n=2 Tax=Malaclemys terrapin pileata TaxID=2991368 RepID=UPI0023A8D0CF|nr:serine/threonine/tyrosine-interacting-like protein 1 isoform X1 [Malaclemys terrapin pileata]XP_053864395.1 serine/threonine/tyrosine-interacting-like protein 1 isoform X1 [Malaclemys terrapin pileata]
MAGLVLCEPTELYNILNQSTKLSRLTEPNYLCLLDARTKREYNESHVITARRVKQNPMGDYLVPDSVELECVKYCVVYDGKTSSLDDIYYDDYEEKKEDEKGTKAASEIAGDESSSSCSQNAEVGAAIQCARVLEQFTRHPVRILKGGYERFTACYHFLRTQKIFWMPQELDAFQPYPVEILPAQLYMGNCRQACDPQIQKDLKIKAQVNISEEIATLFTDESKTLLHVSVADSPDADLFSFFPTICHFIEGLEIHPEMQNKHETKPWLCATAVRLGKPNLWVSDHRYLRTTLLTGSKENIQQAKQPFRLYHSLTWAVLFRIARRWTPEGKRKRGRPKTAQQRAMKAQLGNH